MSEQPKDFPEFYVTTAQACPYLPERLERKLFTHLSPEKPDSLVDNLLKGGFRRSQNIAYVPYCEGCQACVSVRVLVDEFEPSKNFRRLIKRNSDLHIRRILPRSTAEHYRLFRDYIDARHGEGGMADMSIGDFALMIEDTIVDSFLTEYRLRPPNALEGGDMSSWPLLAVALCDRLSDGISMVYSFYDIEAERRSLGTFMVLEHIEYARRLALPYLYLGYWIEGSPKMAYKTRFQPQQRLTPGGWKLSDLKINP